MLSIAICDDDRNELLQTEKLLKEYREKFPELAMHIVAFSSGIALLEHLRINGCFDIYLLDILMPEINGIDLGLKVRKIDNGGSIIYLTSSPDYAIDSYKPHASGYILKPIVKQTFFDVLNEITEKWLYENQTFVTIKSRNGLQRLSIRSVVFGELVGHRVHYHLSDGLTVEGTSVRTSFREAVLPFLEHERFVLCATSFFVNLSYVEMIEATGIKLIGGGTIPLSRTLRADVTNQWLDFHLGGGSTL